MADILKEYEEFTGSTAKYPREPDGINVMYCALGLNGEAGEYAEKVKKGIRDGNFDKPGALLELGDTLFYLTRSAIELGSSLEEVMRLNVAKLRSRQERNQLGGSGDHR